MEGMTFARKWLHGGRVWTAMAITGMLVLVGCGGNSSQTSSSGVTTVHIAHLSALAFAQAYQELDGVTLALKKVNAESTKYKIVIDPPMTTGVNIATAVALTKQNAADSSIMLQLGPFSGNELLALIPQAEALKFPILAPSLSGPIPAFNSWVFRMGAPETKRQPALLAYAKDTLKAKSMAIVYVVEQEASKGSADGMAKLAAQAGITTNSYGVRQTDVDFSSLATTIAGTKPDVIYLATPNIVLPFVMKAIRARGITTPFVSSTSWVNGDLAKIYTNSGKAAEGTIVANPVNLFSNRPIVIDFIAAWSQEHQGLGIGSVGLEVYGYDSVLAISAALNGINGPVTRDSLRQALGKVKFDGVTGTSLTFAPVGYGDVVRAGVALNKYVAPGVLEPLNVA
jgi:branched-chain amino acid transport system substrate-binding protein